MQVNVTAINWGDDFQKVLIHLFIFSRKRNILMILNIRVGSIRPNGKKQIGRQDFTKDDLILGLFWNEVK